MKNTLLVLLVLGSTLGLQARTQPAAGGLSGELPLDQVAAKVHANGDVVTVGTGRALVALRLGSPNRVLPDGSWIYRGYSAQPAPAHPVLRGSLVIRFTDSQVTRLTLADESTVLAFRKALRSPVSDRLLAGR